MSLSVLLSLVLFAPAHSSPLVRLEVTESLVLELDYMPQGETLPVTGFIVPRGVMSRLIAEIRSSSAACSARLRDQELILSEQLRLCSERCTERTGELIARHDQLQMLNEELRVDLAREQREFKWWRIGAYSLGGALLTTLVYAVAR